ncbi:protein PHOTOPERIOD-INDEPENDENT EARLY FLOWERING 1-like isoform X4 [Papaver somniferum]|uniref:protein PHOTOPERIOD-INDEPENDENT EARLY FLOWERING 1-like isoform X4 n=1 Tax=Papaver somniferum TaxID=3469 RepID=UPI000E6FA112|nr:protein PHOTOPERIOD-INDEPENDENT EARLY FLOWERING 1-like isoform X4 [Papaver somniferum]
MASRGPRPKVEHEARPKRQKALEVSREPRRPKTHWDHVLDEMVWLSKDFESERKWKLAQAKKVAIRASKGMLDQATRGEKKVKEEEQKLRKVALNISKDVKKFWTKIEKLVLYKHQLELEEKKKKALDRQLDFLLGQTERYSTMLAENLVDMPYPHKHMCLDSATEQHINHDEGEKEDQQINEDEYVKDDDQTKHEKEEGDQIVSHGDEEGDRQTTQVSDEGEPNDLMGSQDGPDHMDVDGDYDVQSEDESEDDEHTIEEDEALITKEERKAELEGLQDEMDLPLEELLKRYKISTVSREESPGEEDSAEPFNEIVNLGEAGKDAHTSSTTDGGSSCAISHHLGVTNGDISTIKDEHRSDSDIGIGGNQDANKSEMQSTFSDCSDNQEEDGDYIHVASEEKDDETTLVEEEELAKDEAGDAVNEIELLQKESEIPVEELLARYKKDYNVEDDEDDDAHGYTSDSSEECVDLQARLDVEMKGAPSPVNKDAPLEAQPSESKLIIAEQEEDELNIKSDHEKDSDDIIADAAAAARSAQPTGNTFLTTKVRTKFPFLLKYPLREYQHIGLDWLVTMYEKRLNGILADEMGLGKTIMTISLLAHLACEKGIWGPHLIVVPTSVMLNWETEFLKWCPAFKILTYFGSAKERKFKRQGWMKPNSFHVCITTYRLVIQDSKAFKRKKWKYLILDEAHLIKNWKSQRWQTLLNFNSKRRILLTGTPLQNDLMELWSLMHFLMPHIFQSHQEFKDWFSNPISGMVEGQEKVNKEVVDRLHNVLRPFLLRRLKRDVEKQLPGKHEHVIYCRLSKRQRNLYEDFISSSETQATLASSNFFGMISVIMQLRKVCNHPDLFEGRPIISSFDMSGIEMRLSSSICTMLSSSPFSEVNLKGLGLLFTDLDFSMTSWESDEIKAIAPSRMIEDRVTSVDVGKTCSRHRLCGYMKKGYGTNIFDEIQKALWEERLKEAKERARSIAWWNSLQCRKKPMYGTSLRDLVTVRHPVSDIHQQKSKPSCYLDFSSKLASIVQSPVERFQRLIKLIESFMFAIPAARASSPVCWCSKSGATVFSDPSFKDKCTDVLSPLLSPIRPAIVRRQVYFPDRRLVQFDCGKLQQLAVLLRRLKSEGHRALIFTQMTKMLDVLEPFINLYGYTYMRLDGSTPPEERQTLMQRFNTNPKIFLFILSTRSGGVGINLVGADTVIFYDSDWNPAMDQQAQDRCHRIGQTREVHIYRLISESTIEENILKKANQKRVLDDLVIQSGSYNTEFFKKLDPLELFSGHRELPANNIHKEKSSNSGVEVSLSNADVEAALKQAEDEADYMALKKVEQEEAVENQEFLDDAIGRVEDDELANEDDAKFDEKAPEPEDQSTSIAALDNDADAILNGSDPNDDRVLTLTGTEEDDMLADVKQLAAAAAAAGHASSSFENQLRPIDRYAMRFMDLWDPIIDKSALVSQVNFEEKEWELDRIEKFKEDLEAEIDDDEEPFVYEEWDADYATEAYRQQVEVLAQRQLLEDLEYEAKEAEEAEKEKLESLSRNEAAAAAAAEIKSKPKKKTKKKKFKSLKKGALASEVETTLEEPPEHMSIDDESMYTDDLDSYSDFIPSHSPVQKKRKKSHSTQNADEEKTKRKSTKKQKKGPESSRSALEYDSLDKQHAGELMVLDLDHRPPCRSRMGGKISITTMPVKRVLLIKPEKLNKKGSIWLRGCISMSDSWSSSEDAILCAIVHEYGTHWSLVSDVIYGMPAGGFYRGRFRHPFQCCERFRDLFHKNVLSIVEIPNNEKVTNTCSGKSILKVTEDGTQTLLNVTSDLADNECVLQKHFTAILTSVWRARSRFNHWSSLSSTYQEGFDSAKRVFNLRRCTREPLRNLGAVGESSKLVAAALQDAYSKQQEDVSQSEQREAASMMEEPLEIILEVQTDHEDCEIPLPSHVNILIYGSDSPHTKNESAEGDSHLDLRSNMAGHRFRGASKACFDGVTQGWASSSFPAFDFVKSRSTPSKPESAGKPSKSKQLLRGASTEQPREEEHHTPSTSKQTPHILSPKAALAASVGFLSGDSDIIRSCTGGADVGAEDKEDIMGMDGYGFYEVDATLPYTYDPSFISGLDDCTLLPEIIDIG